MFHSSRASLQSDLVSAQIAKAEDMGFVKRLSTDSRTWEIRRILASFIDAQRLGEFDGKLAAYRSDETASGGSDTSEAGVTEDRDE